MARTTTAPTGEIAPLGLRMLPQMRERIEQAARASGRSLNAEIVHRLAQSLGEDFAAEQPAAQPVLAEMLAQMRVQTDYMCELLELARDAANPD
ncbi:Arc family DNA-binding protein [Delftia acidovorans]|uniref:Arc family DNA-binding protein n=1 Tax=Delftia acidovorans TaxID=80866 RepID=UPI002FDC9326